MIPFSKSAQAMRSSEIRRLMKLAADPSVISFAGGMPNNSLFPVEAVDEIWASLAVEEKQRAFQYGPTSGYPPLLKSLSDYLQSKGLPMEGNSLLITTGAQQAINLVTRVLVDPGETIITEYPSFIGALAAFKSYGANLTGVEMDNDGVKIDILEKKLDQGAKILYLSPYFHNPAGIIYSEQRKNEVLKLLNGRDVCLLEDDPYGELYFDESDKKLTVPMKAIAQETVPICYTGSFAKIFGPGMRLGWLLGPAEIIEKCELAKQSQDACSSTFTQVLANAFLSRGKLQPYVTSLRAVYKRRAQIMLDALQQYMPEEVSWTTPKGGFYIWVTMPEHVNASKVFDKSIEKGAAFVIGNAFDPEGKRNNSFRLAFSAPPEDRIAEGIRLVAEAVKSMLKA
ncbi:MAG: PLP-dependent aminotransferase family protein [Chitinivibrionales bacterium]